MYTQFFGLTEKPFSITPDPHFLFLSERHAEALAHLVYGVTESGGFIQLTGEVGTGKTTLTRSLIERLPEQVDLALVLNPRLDVPEFLQTILDELRAGQPGPDASVKDYVDALNSHLLDAHARGRRTVLLVDEAQNLQTDVLEQLRLLTNLETAKEKLLQIILVGQPELRRTLARNDLRQLAQRITGRYHLSTLSAAETAAYVRHRLKVAGADDDGPFTAGALAEVHRLSDGVPRLANVICDRALLGAFVAEQRVVDRSIVRRAAAEVGVHAPSATRPAKPWWIAAAVLLTPAVVAAAWVLGSRVSSREPPSVAVDAPVLLDEQRANRTSLRLAYTRSLPALPSGASLSAVVDAPSSDLDRLLATAPVETDTDSAFSALLTLWGIRYDPDAGPACAQATVAGLRCEFQQGSLSLLAAMNRPAILSLVDERGATHHAVVRHLDTDSAVLVLGGADHRLARAELDRYWFGDYLVIWRPHPQAGALLLPGQRGEGVAWLRQRLEALQGAPATGGDAYDDDLRRRVQQFQRERRLTVDGKAGVQTMIALNSALSVPGTPTLNGGG